MRLAFQRAKCLKSVRILRVNGGRYGRQMAQGASLQAIIYPSKVESPFLLLDCRRILAVMGLISGGLNVSSILGSWGGDIACLALPYYSFQLCNFEKKGLLRSDRCIQGTKLKFICSSLGFSWSLFLFAVVPFFFLCIWIHCWGRR